MESIAIVAVGYNRPDSLEQLLRTIVNADYADDQVDLIISLDKGEKQKENISVAEKIYWQHGEKIIRSFPERVGLRAHIIQCGDLTDKYDAVVVLEDDLLVSPSFYSYVKQALYNYCDDEHIGGISLYRHYLNQGVNRPFEPVNNGYDIYLQQFAASWGQCWSKRMWDDFRKWYSINADKDLSEGNLLPSYISNWNQESWLKYYMRYIVEKDKYFIYPYYSLSTNCSEVGEHSRLPNNDYQVPLQEGSPQYRFPTFEQSIKYDVFFERVGIDNIIFPELHGRKLLDLYGNRTAYGNARYLISTNSLPYKVVRKAQLRYRPIEVNAIKPINGEGLYVYDLKVTAPSPKVRSIVLTRFDIRTIHWKRTLIHGLNGFFYALFSRMSIKSKRW